MSKTLEELWDRQYQLTEVTSSTAKFRRKVDSHHMAVGISDEAGEILGLDKKQFFQGHEDDMLKEIVECGDLLFYLNRYMKLRGFTLEQCLRVNIAKLKVRYPDGFDSGKSVNRDKEVERKAIEEVLYGTW